MTCKDCVHYEACEISSVYFGEEKGSKSFREYEKRQNVELDCDQFKDKTQLVELPCKINERLYYANKTLDEVCEAIVIRIDINYIEEPYIWLTLD